MSPARVHPRDSSECEDYGRTLAEHILRRSHAIDLYQFIFAIGKGQAVGTQVNTDFK